MLQLNMKTQSRAIQGKKTTINHNSFSTINTDI